MPPTKPKPRCYVPHCQSCTYEATAESLLGFPVSISFDGTRIFAAKRGTQSLTAEQWAQLALARLPMGTRPTEPAP